MSKETNKEITKINLTTDFLTIGDLLCGLGSIQRTDRLNNVLITDTYMKTYGGGIFAKFSYKSLGFNTGFVPIDSKMFFNRETGDYSLEINKKESSVEIKGKGRKTNIPFISYQEYNNTEEYDETLEFRCPGDELMKTLTFSNKENTIVRVKLTKDDLNKIKNYQSYLGHKPNEECFKITFNPDDKKELIIKIEDNSLCSESSKKNKRMEEIIISESAIEINNLKKSELTVTFSPKFIPSSDDFIMTIYKVTSPQTGAVKSFIKFDGCLLDYTIYTFANEEEINDEVKEVSKKETKKEETKKEETKKDMEKIVDETSEIDDLLNENFEDIVDEE